MDRKGAGGLQIRPQLPGYKAPATKRKQSWRSAATPPLNQAPTTWHAPKTGRPFPLLQIPSASTVPTPGSLPLFSSVPHGSPPCWPSPPPPPPPRGASGLAVFVSRPADATPSPDDSTSRPSSPARVPAPPPAPRYTQAIAAQRLPSLLPGDCAQCYTRRPRGFRR